jgi:hypothetical protein
MEATLSLQAGETDLPMLLRDPEARTATRGERAGATPS